MKSAIPMILTEQKFKEIFDFSEENSRLAKNLYNAGLFRVRQVFTGWGKDAREWNDNQKTVFDEIEVTKSVYKGVSCRRVLKYHPLEKIMRATKNPDFFAGLPMQTAQAVLRQVAQDFQDWLDNLKAYKKNPEAFTGRPGMPKYCRSDKKTFVVTNQDAVLYPSKDGTSGECELKLPGFPRGHRFPLSYVSEKTKLCQMTFKPYYGTFIMTFVVEDMAPPFYPDMPNMAGLDLGVDNIAAIACTDGSSAVYKGGAVLSGNRDFAKKRASAVSILTKGTKNKKADSAFLSRLSLHHDCFIKDQMHKISTDIIRFCIQHRAGTLVIGSNTYWKQHMNMGKRNNQNFGGLPHSQLKQMIQYKAMIAGIDVVLQEESYTSKADVTAGDFIPVYGKDKGRHTFSGRRVERGLYLCSKGYCINADCNGAANILRKAFPDAWKDIDDFHFLAAPESIGFRKLNPSVYAGKQAQRDSNKKKVHPVPSPSADSSQKTIRAAA